MAEAMDWTEVLEAPCPFCGEAPAEVAPEALPEALREQAARWEVLLAGGDDERLRTRPEDGSWTALEYGCHCRDVLSVMTERVARVLVEDEPDFGWWDHEAAAVDEHYNEQDPTAVAGDLAANAEWLAGTLGLVQGDEWGRTGIRGDGTHLSVAGIGRFTLHELAHHRWDAEARLA
jgi:hypothetical protein